MVRTKTEPGAVRSTAAKAPRKMVSTSVGGGSSSSSSGGKADRYAGGNPYCPRPTPQWQKEIGNFFTKTDKLLITKSSTVKNDITKSSSSMNGLTITDCAPGSSKDASASKFETNGLISDDED